MIAIWKFPIVSVEDEVVLQMPKFAEILTLQMQDKVPCIWAMVDTEKSTEPREFAIRGTGHPIEKNRYEKYVGTFQFNPLVFHVFDKLGRLREI